MRRVKKHLVTWDVMNGDHTKQKLKGDKWR